MQCDGCTKGVPLSVIFSNISLTKLEIDKVKPMKPLLYKRFIDDVINMRKKSKPDSLLTLFNNSHLIKNFTVEVNPSRILDANFQNVDTKIEASVYRKTNELPIHLTSKVPKCY